MISKLNLGIKIKEPLISLYIWLPDWCPFHKLNAMQIISKSKEIKNHDRSTKGSSWYELKFFSFFDKLWLMNCALAISSIADEVQVQIFFFCFCEIPLLFFKWPQTGSFTCMNPRQSTPHSAIDKSVELHWWTCGDKLTGYNLTQTQDRLILGRTSQPLDHGYPQIRIQHVLPLPNYFPLACFTCNQNDRWLPTSAQ
jgi:hypothetical protein